MRGEIEKIEISTHINCIIIKEHDSSAIPQLIWNIPNLSQILSQPNNGQINPAPPSVARPGCQIPIGNYILLINVRIEILFSCVGFWFVDPVQEIID